MALPGEADIRPDVYVGLDSARRDFPTPPNLCRRFAAAEVRRSEGIGRWRSDPRAKARV
jgi:hypothetical protein